MNRKQNSFSGYYFLVVPFFYVAEECRRVLHERMDNLVRFCLLIGYLFKALAVKRHNLRLWICQ